MVTESQSPNVCLCPPIRNNYCLRNETTSQGVTTSPLFVWVNTCPLAINNIFSAYDLLSESINYIIRRFCVAPEVVDARHVFTHCRVMHNMTLALL